MKWSVIRDFTIIGLLGTITVQVFAVNYGLSELTFAIKSFQTASLSSDSSQQGGLAYSLSEIHSILDSAEVLSPRYGIYEENEVGRAMGRPVYQRVHSNKIAREELENRLQKARHK